MFQTQANSPITFRFHISMQAKIIRTSSCSEKSGKTGKNAPSVTGGQRAVTFCVGVSFPYKESPANRAKRVRLFRFGASGFGFGTSDPG